MPNLSQSDTLVMVKIDSFEMFQAADSCFILIFLTFRQWKKLRL